MRFDIRKINTKFTAFILAAATLFGVPTLSASASALTNDQKPYSVTFAENDTDVAALSLSTRSSGYENAKAAVIKSCRNFETTCSVKEYGITLDEARAIMSEIMNQYEFYYIGGCSYEFYRFNNAAGSITFSYKATKSEVDAASKKIDAIAAMKPDDITTDVDIALWLHDYICVNYEYDTTYKNYCPNEMLRDGRGVCQAYTELYGLLLEHFGIESYYVSSDAMSHAWNVVKINGEWYHIDVTWDDPTPDRSGRAKHEYFLRSDKKITELNHHDWESDIKCTSTKYDGDLLAVSDCALVWSSGKWYCADSTGGKVYQLDLKNNSQKVIYTYNEKARWRPNGPSSHYYYEEKFLTICAYNGELYFNGPNDIYHLDPKSGAAVKVHSYKGGDACIYTVVADSDCIRYSTYADINSGTATIHSFTPGHIHHYENGVCSCGEYEDGIGARLAGYTLSLDGRIGVNFYMELVDSVAASTDTYLHFTLPDGTTEDVRVADAEKRTVSGKTYYVFSCHINVYDMTTDATAQIFCGSSRGSVYTFTVADYAYYIIDNPQNYSAGDIAFAKALLNYGTAAQNYFNVSTDSPANKDLSESDRKIDALTPSDLEDYYRSPESVDCVGTFSGFNLFLGSQTTLRVYFEPGIDVDIESIEFMVNGASVNTEKSGKYYRIAKGGINAGELGDDFVFSATIGDKVLTQSYSAMSYCYAILSQDTDNDVYTAELKTMISALYVYMNAASIYR